MFLFYKINEKLISEYCNIKLISKLNSINLIILDFKLFSQ